MSEKKDYTKAVRVMRLHGGAFARSIASAWGCADPVNQDKLEEAFQELFNKYARDAEKL